jgi:MerR family redox-sensitive transcriptional activator SoxR
MFKSRGDATGIVGDTDADGRVVITSMGTFDWHEAGLAVGQVAQRSGVAPSALRFYERQGLITTVRTGGNQRRYLGDVLCRVAMIRACQRVGLSVAEIRIALAELPEGHIPGPDDWERLARRLKHVLRDRLDELNGVLEELSQHDPAAGNAHS